MLSVRRAERASPPITFNNRRVPTEILACAAQADRPGWGDGGIEFICVGRSKPWRGSDGCAPLSRERTRDTSRPRLDRIRPANDRPSTPYATTGWPGFLDSPDFFILFFRGAQRGLSLEWRRCCSALLAPPRPALSRSVAPTAITPSPRGASEVHPRSSAGSTTARTAGGGASGRCPTGEEAGGAVRGRSGSTARSRSEVHRRAPCTRRRRRVKSATEACPRRSSTTS